MAPPVNPTKKDGPEAIVWTSENNFSSDGKTKTVVLEKLPPNAQEACGTYFCVNGADGVTLKGKFSYPPIAPGQTNRFLTSSQFDQVFAYHTLNGLVSFLDDKLGIDMRLVVEAGRREKFMPMRVRMNIPGLSNAYFDPEEMTINFGDGGGLWHFGSDGDIDIHEAFHWVIDRVNPRLSQGMSDVAAALHEGGADFGTAIRFNDPELAEDFGVWDKGTPSPDGLRNVDNNNTFSNTLSRDPHVMGNIYSGFLWSLKGRLLELLKNKNQAEYAKDPAAFDERARVATLTLFLVHLQEYKTSTPQYDEFMDNMVNGLKSLVPPNSKESLLEELTDWNVSPEAVESEIRKEAGKRGFPQRKKQALPPSKFNFAAAPKSETDGLRGLSKSSYFPQFVKTKYGNVEVFGHGMVVKSDHNGEKRYTEGARVIAPGEIDEHAPVTQEAAYRIALKSIDSKLSSLLVKRLGKGESERIIAKTRSSLENKGQGLGKLAVMPGEKRLSWYFEAGPVRIVVNAVTEDVTMHLKLIIG
ncbi:MAG: hypothetical protein V2A66_00960 [Pseudomonadota bacterium]